MFIHTFVLYMGGVELCFCAQTVFKITREQFKRFPAWKQTDIKKLKGLF